jgi:hypothetical protein
MVEKFEYGGEENPLPGNLNALALAIEAKLEGDPDIATIGVQYFSLFEAGAYFMWQRNSVGGFLYPTTTTDYLRAVGMKFDDQATVPGGAPGAGYGTLWAKNTSPTQLYFTDSGGTDHRMATYFKDARQINVSKSGSSGGDGSTESPLLTIQSAIDMAAALAPIPDATHPVLISVGPGIYNENVIHDVDGIHVVGHGRYVTTISPTLGPGYKITNATRASVAAYNISEDYADLVNNGSGPRSGSIQNLTIISNAVGQDALQMFGVKGDASPTTTNFGDGGLFVVGCQCSVFGAGGALGIYIRNVGWCQFDTSWWMGPWLEINCSYPTFELCDMGGPGNIYYDGTDVAGKPAYGLGVQWLIGIPHIDINMHGESVIMADGTVFYDVLVDGTACFSAMGCWFDILDFDDTATILIQGGFARGALNVEGGVAATLNGLTVLGAATVVAGPGLVACPGCSFLGGLTDAGSKVDMTQVRRGEKSGTATAGGAGDVVVSFTVAFLNANYKIALGNVGAAAAVVKATTKAAGGFTLTFAAAGDCDWTATHD